jgi:hypothetical protein
MIQQKSKNRHKRSSGKFLWFYCLLFTLINVGRAEIGFARVLIKDGDPEWCYFKGTSEPPVDPQGRVWREVGYSSCDEGAGSGWASGPSGFGYDAALKYATTLSDMRYYYSSLYVRHEFDILDPDKLEALNLSIKYDDGFVAYINGVEVARRKMPAKETNPYPSYDVLATSTMDYPTLEEIIISRDEFNNFNLTAGKNVLAIQGHNRSKDRSSDFALVVSLGAETNKQLPILPGDTWRYLKGNDKGNNKVSNSGYISSNWKKIDFDDSAWAKGCSGFGYGDNDDCTELKDMKGNYTSVYIRKEFEITDKSSLKNMQYLTLSVNYDDGFVAYLNEKEVARRNMSSANLSNASIIADSDREAVIKEVFDLTGFIGDLNLGKNVLAIQGHNKSKDSGDFSLIPALTNQPVLLVGAGDIAGNSYQGAGTTKKILDNILEKADVLNSAVLFTLGDNVYATGTYTEFNNYYEPAWGKYKGITRPSAGNHEYFCTGYNNTGTSNHYTKCTTNADGYFKYFNDSQESGRAGNKGEGYYSYDHGAWHIIVLNTCLKAAKTNGMGCSDENADLDSAQMTWLEKDLDKNKDKDTLVYFHHPRYTNAKVGGSIAGLEDLWTKLYAAGVDVVLNGHFHNYQRFAPKRPDGADGVREDVYGMRQFIVGSGGYGLKELKSPTDESCVPDMDYANDGDYGVLQLILTKGRYDWKFITEDGVKDCGSSATHGPPDYVY